jgi:phosphate:Na+ symporter
VIFGTLTGDPMLDMLIGAVFTMFSWSSLAVVLLSATLASSQVISVPVALGLVLGANLGSGLLAVLVTLQAPGSGRSVALGNLVFKVVGCVIFVIALPWVHQLIALFDADSRRQVVHFHVIFNVTLAVIFIGIAGRVAAVVEKFFPPTEDAALKPRAQAPRPGRAHDAGPGARQRRPRDASHRRHRRADAARLAGSRPHERRAQGGGGHQAR